MNAARDEKLGPNTARVDINERIRSATLLTVPNCALLTYQVVKSATIWHRDGMVHELRYLDNKAPTLSSARRPGHSRQSARGLTIVVFGAAAAQQVRQSAG